MWALPVIFRHAFHLVLNSIISVHTLLNRTDIPVFSGHSCPTTVPLVTAPQFHGETGLDGPVLPEPTIKAQSKHAVDFIVETVMNTEDIRAFARISAAMSFTKLPVDQIPTIITGRTL